MDLQNNNGAHVQNGTAKENSKTAQNGASKEITASSPKAGTNGKAEAEKPKPAPVKEEKTEPVAPQPPEAQEPAPAAAQASEGAKPAAPVLNLDGTLKVVADLHRKSVQRINLLSRMGQLEAFEVALVQEHDELEENPYQGCKLIIRDDKNREFLTTTPGLIRLVSQFIFSACNEKLAEIEKSIVFPND